MEDILLRCFLGGTAATGFAILFNVPQRSLLPIFFMGAVALLIKTIGLEVLRAGIVPVSLLCSSVVGGIAVLLGKIKKTPPLTMSIPSVIPLVPGIFIYNAMLGIIKLPSKTSDEFFELLSITMNNGLKATFILMCLAIGIILPNLLLRKETFYEGTKK